LQVAIKLFDKTKINDKYVRDNLYREGKVLAKMCHPHVIRVS